MGGPIIKQKLHKRDLSRDSIWMQIQLKHTIFFENSIIKTFELLGLNFCFIIEYPPVAHRIVTIFTFQTGDIEIILRRSVTSQVIPGTSNEF